MGAQNQLKDYANFNRIRENAFYTYGLIESSILLQPSAALVGHPSKAVLSFGLRGVDFNKKKALPFFLAIELLAGQKCVATVSSRNVLSWKLRKGALSGCKVTLRGEALYSFLDNLVLALPRMEKFSSLSLDKVFAGVSGVFSLEIREVMLFYPIELGLGVNTEARRLTFSTAFRSFSGQEKALWLYYSKIPIAFGRKLKNEVVEI